MKLNVAKQRSIWWLVSGVLLVVSIVAMAISWSQFNGPIRPGLDFIGGTRLQLERSCSDAAACTDPIDLVEIRAILDEQGLEGSSLQLVGDSGQALSIRTRNLDVDEQANLRSALEENLGQVDPTASKIDVVGPTIGKQLLTAGLLSLIVAFVGITVYLSLRFKFDYAFLALIALMHDAIITLGIFSLLGLTLGYEADSLFIVALLTIVGFSVNDTVVIYDRIRENFKLMSDHSVEQIVNDAVNQTLGRSVNTTMTTILPLIAIVIFGGDTLKFFALALIVGFLAGAYSSIFIASTLLAWWRSSSKSNTDITASAAD